MKTLLTEWIVNLTLFSLLTSLIIKILPGKGYIPYIQILGGIMMILTLLQPLLQLTGLEDAIDWNLSREMYEMEMRQIENSLIKTEEEQMRRVEERYEEYLEEQVLKEQSDWEKNGWEEEIKSEEGKGSVFKKEAEYELDKESE